MAGYSNQGREIYTARVGEGDTVGADSTLLTFQMPAAEASDSNDDAEDAPPLGGLRPEKLRASGNVVVDTGE